ncbi:MAG TPA: STM3941 family protein [Pyrinomonadaceae bacterium]|jgi:hypothetical protein
MNPTDETIIELSRAKLVLTVLGSCAFVALGAWLLSFDAREIQYGRSFTFFYNSPPIVYGMGVAAILFFGLCGLYGLFKVFDRKPGLILNSSGIHDNASGVAAGFIPWAEVLGASVYEIHNQKMLVIGVRDPQKYLARGGALKRAFNKANAGMSGSPVSISSVALKINFAELVSLFNRYHQRYGAAAARED